MGEEPVFLKNLRVSLFNDDLSNEPDISQIHLAGHWTVPLRSQGIDSKESILPSWRACMAPLLLLGS
jgi:hypothetical protein